MEKATMNDKHEWMREAACRGTDINLFFSERGDHKTMMTAMEICNGTRDTPACPVRDECLAWANSFEDDNHGVYGGLTPSARMKLRRGQRRADQLRDEQMKGQHTEPIVAPATIELPPLTQGRQMSKAGVMVRNQLPDKPLPTDYEWRLGLRQLLRLVHEAVLDDENQRRSELGVGPIAISIRD
jgi:hypothetical protein